MSTQTHTVELTPTAAATKDEYFMPVGEECTCCDSDASLLVARNSSKGQRKTAYLCEGCLSDWEDAPDGLFDPLVIAEK